MDLNGEAQRTKGLACTTISWGAFVGHNPTNRYQRQIAKIRAHRRDFTELLKNANLQINDATCETAKSILEMATRAESLWKLPSPPERKKLLDDLLSNQVLDGPTVRYELKKPFKTLSEMKQDQNWRTERDWLRPSWAWSLRD